MAVQLTVSSNKRLTDLFLVSKNYSLDISNFTETTGSTRYYYVLSSGITDLEAPEKCVIWSTGYISKQITLHNDVVSQVYLKRKPNYVTDIISQQLSNTCFRNNTVIESVDCCNVLWQNNDMTSAFEGCSNLTTVTNINSGITNITTAFKNCNKLTQVSLPSYNISSATNAFIFSGTAQSRYVYCPFQNSAKTEISQTLQSLLNAGYDSYGSKHNVYLYNLQNLNPTTSVKIKVYPNPTNCTVTFYNAADDSVITKAETNAIILPASSLPMNLKIKLSRSDLSDRIYNVNNVQNDMVLKLENTKLKLPYGQAPSSYSVGALVASAEANTYTTYTVPASGWYYVDVLGAGASYSGDWVEGRAGGRIQDVMFLHKGTICLLWGSTTSSRDMGTPGQTGFPSPTNYWGGSGYTGHSEGGGGGGGAANHGKQYCHWDGGCGAGGSGFLAGTTADIDVATFSNSGVWERNFSSADTYSVAGINLGHLYVAVLCGGGGGACGANDDIRSAGGGGGAYGDGGDAQFTGDSSDWNAYKWGPGRSWGQGELGHRYGGGGRGAASVLDLSTYRLDSTIGGGSHNTNGFCRLYQVNV